MVAVLIRCFTLLGLGCAAVLGLNQYVTPFLPDSSDTGFCAECAAAPNTKKLHFLLSHAYGKGDMTGWIALKVNGIAAQAPFNVEIDEGPAEAKLKGPELTCYAKDGWLRIGQLRTGTTATAEPHFKWPNGCKLKAWAPDTPVLTLADLQDWEVYPSTGPKDSKWLTTVRGWKNWLLLFLSIGALCGLIDVAKFARPEVTSAAVLAAWIKTAQGTTRAETRNLQAYLRGVVLDQKNRDQVLNNLHVTSATERRRLQVLAQNHLEALSNQWLTDFANHLHNL